MLESLIAQHPFALLAALPAGVAVAHLIPWLLDPYHVRDIPGPWLAKFSDSWLGYWAATGKRSEHVHDIHTKYGILVRLAPNHISIADSDALQTVYGHGTGTLKSNFYDAFVLLFLSIRSVLTIFSSFVSLKRGLFNTRSRPEHTRKRKIVSHVFSQKNVLEFEPNIRAALLLLTKQWDMITDRGAKGLSGEEGESTWQAKDGRAWFDCLPWYNYLAFDIIGDLAFGEPFGMLEKAADSAPVAVDNEAAMAQYSKMKSGNNNDEPVIAIKYIPAIQILNSRGDFSASMGVLPPWVRPWVKKIPWYAKGNIAVQHLAGIAVAAVGKRLALDAKLAEVGGTGARNDLLRRLQEARDDQGRPMDQAELTAEALTQLIAGSDTTSNSSCAITYYLSQNPEAQKELQKELDDAFGLDDTPVLSYDQVKALPYLEACINEGLRLHSTSSLGLPRLVPEGGLEILGRRYEEGTVVSVPSFTIHREAKTWGNDYESYRPERWFEIDQAKIQKCFNPFSYGPRACVGKNLATMELQMIIGTVARRYDFVPASKGETLATREGFLRKPLVCKVGIRRRNV